MWQIWNPLVVCVAIKTFQLRNSIMQALVKVLLTFYQLYYDDKLKIMTMTFMQVRNMNRLKFDNL